MSEPSLLTKPEPPQPAPTQLPSPLGAEPPTHWLQRLMDNPWLLLVLGVVIPTLSYTIWGIIDLMLIPRAIIP